MNSFSKNFSDLNQDLIRKQYQQNGIKLKMMTYTEMLYYLNPNEVVVGVVEKLRAYALGVSRRDGKCSDDDDDDYINNYIDDY